jgi:hypothetical protein
MLLKLLLFSELAPQHCCVHKGQAYASGGTPFTSPQAPGVVPGHHRPCTLWSGHISKEQVLLLYLCIKAELKGPPRPGEGTTC